MPIPSTNSSVKNERVLVDDLPYIDQEYGDPGLREAVSYINITKLNRLDQLSPFDAEQ